MNCFAHALPFFDRPYFAVGTCIPDWLTACDRKCRARKKKAVAWIDDSDPILAAVAAGVVQHHEDDYWFHGSAIFTRITLELAVEYREQFGNTQAMRANLIGHIVIEMFLDAFLESKFPGSMEKMYDWVAELDAEKVQDCINHFASQPTTKLAGEIERFQSERYLFDYQKDEGVRYRMNNVLGRLNLELMPEESLPWLEKKRQQVFKHAEVLLAQHQKIVR